MHQYLRIVDELVVDILIDMGSSASVAIVPSETLGTEAHEAHEDKDNKPLPFPKQGVVVRYLENFIDYSSFFLLSNLTTHLF